MKTLINPTQSKLFRASKFGAVMLIGATALVATAADIHWTGGSASYATAANWDSNSVPGATDSAINDNGTGNAVQINGGDPDWTVGQIRAGNSAGNGAFVQNGQTVTVLGTNYNGPVITEYFTPFRLGILAADTGIYTLNGGTLNYGSGQLSVGTDGTGIMNINGGSINGGGNFTVNAGGITTPNPAVLTATAGHGPYLGDFTYFEKGYYTPNGSLGLPPAGTTVNSVGDPTGHSYTLAPSYTGPNAVIVDAAVSNATITLGTPTVCSALSFMCSCGNGPVHLNYTVNHSSGVAETGTLTVQDWFAGTNTINATNEVLATYARVDALGRNFQITGPVNGMAGNPPYMWSVDVPVSNPNTVTSINLTYVDGGGSFATATILGVSAQTGGSGPFTPLAINGYNYDVVVENGAPSPVVSPSITDIANQTNGTLNISGELWVGNGGVGIYNFTNGSINASNWVNVGRYGGNGTFNMAGGTINKSGSAFTVGANAGNAAVGAVGIVNQSGGTINSSSEVWIGQANNNPGLGTGTYNISGTAALNVTNWLAVGREGGIGTLNITGGSITKTGNGNITITHGTGANGIVNQSGGLLTVSSGQVWIGEDSSSATWTMSGGAANLGVVHIVQNSTAAGTLNLNGGVMALQELTTGNTSGYSTLTFNGGTLQATTDNANFLHDITEVDVNAGGMTIDSQGYNVTIPQALPTLGAGSGGLTKVGSGTLTLSGANSYAGATVVNAGTLIANTFSTGGGDYTVADGAGLGVTVMAANSQLFVQNLTFGATSATIGFDLGNYGNPGLGFAPIYVGGTLTMGGTVTINIADSLPQIGQFPLVQYQPGGRVGTPTFVIGSLPTGVTASIVDNTANNSIDLNIIGVNQPRWDGQAGGTWDTGSDTNWVNIGTGMPTFYTEGSPVRFDDSALGTTTVNVTTTVHPSSITITNSSLSYTFVGSGSIAGSIGLNKQGSNTLSLLNNNSYTGPTVISNGKLTVTNLANGGAPSAIGASSANPTNLVINNGATFQYAGAPVSVNRGYTANSGIIDAEGDFTLTGLGQTASGTLIKVGPAKMTYAGVGVNALSAANVGGSYRVDNGTVVLDGSAGGQTNNVAGEIWVGGTPSTGANLILTNTTLNVGSWLGLGRGNGTINNTSTITMYNSTAKFGNVSLGYWNGIVGNLASQFLTLNGNSSVIDSGDMNLGESAGSTATININGTSVLSSQNRCYLGLGSGTATSMTIADSGQFTVVNGWFSVANGDNSTGSLVVKNNGSARVSGDFNITDTGTNTAASLTVQDNAVVSGNAVFFGKGARETATVTVSGGQLIARGGDLQVGASGNATLNQTGGTVTGTNWISIGRNTGGVGTYNISGGTLQKIFTGNGTRLNVAENGTGTLTVSGTGSVYLPICWLDICSGGGNGTVNLNGGSITVQQVTHLGGGTATFNFNGGTLIAGVLGGPNLMQGLTAANVLSGGAIVDSGTNKVSIGQALLGGANDGGLTKQGNGTLYLNGVNTYTNTTTVSAGTLGGTGTIAGPVNVAAGATLAPGASIGTLTINNALTLAGTSSTKVEVSLDGGVTNNDLVTGLTSVSYGGSLIVSNIGTNALTVGAQFKLFNSATAGSGNFSSVTVLPAGAGTFNPATGILTITSTGSVVINPVTVSAGNLILTGNGGTPGGSYTWLTSTNVASPIATWTTNLQSTFDGTGAFSNAIPIIATEPAQFFRLRTP